MIEYREPLIVRYDAIIFHFQTLMNAQGTRVEMALHVSTIMADINADVQQNIKANIVTLVKKTS